MNKTNTSLKELCKPYEGYSVVYAFSDSDSIVYIGSTGNLYKRLLGHNSLNNNTSVRSKSGKKTKHFNISVIICTKDHYNIRRFEQNAIDQYATLTGKPPKYNIQNAYSVNKKYLYTDKL